MRYHLFRQAGFFGVSCFDKKGARLRLAPRAPKADAPHGHRRAPRRRPQPHLSGTSPRLTRQAPWAAGPVEGWRRRRRRRRQRQWWPAVRHLRIVTDPLGSVQHCPDGSTQPSLPHHLAGHRHNSAQQAIIHCPTSGVVSSCQPPNPLRALRSFSQPHSLRPRLRPPTALHRPLRMSCRPRGSGPGLRTPHCTVAADCPL